MTEANLSLSLTQSSGTISNLDNTEEISRVKNFVKDLLKARIFLGRYVERRLVNKNVGYRDIVLISPAEIEIKKDLLSAQHALRAVTTNWIGITDAEGIFNSCGVCLWTEIDNEPLGPFWFQIKSIKYRDNEVLLVLKCLRHISDSYLEIEPLLTGKIKKTTDDSACKPDSSHISSEETYREIVDTLKSALTIRNLKEFFTFLVAFFIAIFTGSVEFVNFTGNFVLALIRETSVLVKNSTPMFLGVLDFFSKIVGGFYILLAMFFRPSNTVPQNKRSLRYERPQSDTTYYDGTID